MSRGALLAAAAILLSLGANGGSAATGAARQPTARAHPVFAPLRANTALDLGRFQCTDVQGEHSGRCARVTDYSGMVYDTGRHRMLVFGGGHASTNYDSVNTFDLNTLKWLEEYLPTPCSFMTASNFDQSRGLWRTGPANGPYPRAAARHTTDQLVVVGDELIVLAGVEGNAPCPHLTNYTSYEFRSAPRASHYNLETKTWTIHSAEGGQQWPGVAFDPVSKKIMLLGQVGLDVYDPVTKTKTRAIDLSRVYGVRDEHGKPLQNPLRYNNNLVYFPPDQKMYYFEAAGRRVYELTLNRDDFSQSTIRRLETTGTPPPAHPMGYAYDSASKVIGGGPVHNVFYAFDPATKAWRSHSIQGGTPGSVAYHALDYDPVNNVFIFLTDHASGRKTWAYRYAH